MIRPLRRRHLWMVAGMAAVVAPLALAALASRPAAPLQPGLPVGLVAPPAAAAGEGVELPTSPPLMLRPAAAGTLVAEAASPLEGADLLLYWAPVEAGAALADAYLLGPVRGGERQLFALPEESTGRAGSVVLYSLGHGEVVATTPWPATAEAAP